MIQTKTIDGVLLRDMMVAGAAMLEKKHGCFDGETYDRKVISGETELDAVAEEIIAGRIRK